MSQESEESPESKHRGNWEETHAVIGQAYVELIGELEKRPSIRQVAKKTAFAINTVHAHFKELQVKTLGDRFESFRVLSDRILIRLYKTARDGGPGSIAATKLYFQIVENWKPGIVIELEEKGDLSNLTLPELLKREADIARDIDKRLLELPKLARLNKKTG